MESCTGRIVSVGIVSGGLREAKAALKPRGVRFTGAVGSAGDLAAGGVQTQTIRQRARDQPRYGKPVPPLAASAAANNTTAPLWSELVVMVKGGGKDCQRKADAGGLRRRSRVGDFEGERGGCYQGGRRAADESRGPSDRPAGSGWRSMLQV